MLPALLVVVLALRRSGEACHRKVSPRSPPRVPATARTQRRVLSFLRSRCGGDVEMRVMGSLATGRRCHLLSRARACTLTSASPLGPPYLHRFPPAVCVHPLHAR